MARLKKLLRAKEAVFFNNLTGYINSDVLRKTLFNAGKRHGGFQYIKLYQNRTGTMPGYDNKNDTLIVMVNTSLIPSGKTYIFKSLSNTSQKRHCTFDGVSVDWAVYTGTTEYLCNTITFEADGKDIVVADVVWPNIINIRLLNMKFGNFSGNIGSEIETLHTFRNLSRIVREGVKLLNLPKKEFFTRIILGRKENLSKIIYQKIEESVEVIKQNIINCEDEISVRQKQIAELEVSLKSHKEALEGYDALMDNLKEKFLREIEIIKNISQVDFVDEYSDIDKGIIKVNVSKIKTLCQKSWYYFGDYIISIDITNNTVRFTNKSGLTRKSYWGANCQHPHCSEDGRPCLGNLSTQVVELLKSLDLAFLVNLCISYLQSVNLHDIAGRNVVNWPLCDENGKIISDRNEKGLIKCVSCDEYMPETDNNDWRQCDDCGQWMCGEHGTDLDTIDGPMHVCSICEVNYKHCSHCGKYELRDLMTMCDVCGTLVCSNCLNDELPHFAYYNGDRVTKVCKEHRIHKCEGCGLYLVETDTCPSCEEGNFSVGVCAICGETTPTDLFREDYVDVCVYCDPTGYLKCSRCNRYDHSDNLIYDVVTGECYHEDCEVPDEFDPTTLAEQPDEGALELQRRRIENDILEYAEVNEITVSDDWVNDTVEEIQNRLYSAMGVPRNMLLDEDEDTATLSRTMIAAMFTQALADAEPFREAVEEERIVADAELTPLPEGIQEFYNQPVINEETMPFPDGTTYEDPMTDDIITG